MTPPLPTQPPAPPPGDPLPPVPNSRPTVGPIEHLVSSILQAGVYTSLTLITLGLLLWFARTPELLSSPRELTHLLSPATPVPNSPTKILTGLRQANGESLVALGLLVLIATPALRVAISGLSFARTKDYPFVWISGLVLALLTVSIYLGYQSH